MYQITNAHLLTLVIIMASIMVTPIYIFATYVFSGASKIKGLITGIAFLLFGSLMFWVCLSNIPNEIGLLGQLIIPIAWLMPSIILLLKKNWFLSQRLSQRWLVGLQVFRAIGGVFLIEMYLGNIPGIFAYPAGIGDIAVAVIALAVLLGNIKEDRISAKAIFMVILLGVLDFLSAFFFGFFSFETPLQIFHPQIQNNVAAFPTGMIPLFLVPYAIFFHTLSALNYIKFDKN